MCVDDEHQGCARVYLPEEDLFPQHRSFIEQQCQGTLSGHLASFCGHEEAITTHRLGMGGRKGSKHEA